MTRATVQPFCRWTEDDEGNWDTDCGERYILITGTPRENRMAFCAYCGKRLKQRAQGER
jgi:hypothetical protein